MNEIPEVDEDEKSRSASIVKKEEQDANERQME